MSNQFTTELLAYHQASKARVLHITTPHGSFTTPVFMPVGTRAGVNNLMPEELEEAQSQIILGGNTYHMLCAPGLDVIKNAGGMHAFMGWDKPMLTDSGGFQIFSLARTNDRCRIDNEGAHLQLPGTTSPIHITPRLSLQTQKILGADIIMAFDQCIPDNRSHEEVQNSLKRTHRWLEESLAFHHAQPYSVYGLKQALFGIIQGGVYKDLRQESAEIIRSFDLDGIAIGGETIGFNMTMTVQILRWLHPYFLENKPVYSMGVGLSPQDLLDVVAEGVDMFDCVAPTRNARHGALYCGEIKAAGNWLRFESPYPHQRIQIKKACFATDRNPIMTNCLCYTCKNFSRAYLHHLYKQKQNLFTALASIHNIFVMQDVCSQMRTVIMRNKKRSLTPYKTITSQLN